MIRRAIEIVDRRADDPHRLLPNSNVRQGCHGIRNLKFRWLLLASLALTACKSVGTQQQTLATHPSQTYATTEAIEQVSRRNQELLVAIEAQGRRIDALYERPAATSDGSHEAILRAIERLQAKVNRHAKLDQQSLSTLRSELERSNEAQAALQGDMTHLREDLARALELLQTRPVTQQPDLTDLRARVQMLEKKQNDNPLLSASNYISLFGVLLGFAMGAWVTPWLNRRVDQRKYTLQLWESFLKMIPDIEAAQSSLSAPLTLTQQSFAKVQAVRLWMSAIAEFASGKTLVDNALLARLDLRAPMQGFMSALKTAVRTIDDYVTNNAAAPNLADARLIQQDLKDELQRAADIEQFCR